MSDYKRKNAIRLREIVLRGYQGYIDTSKAAKMLNVSRPSLSNLLNGKSELSLEMAFKIQAIFRYNALELLKMQLTDKYDDFITGKGLRAEGFND